MKYKPWLSTSRQEQLDMLLRWLLVLSEKVTNEKGEKTPRWKLWGLTEDIMTDLEVKAGEAQAALFEAKNEETRTKVVDQRVRVAFKAMMDAMKAVKRRFFQIPPLTEADYVSLGLTVPNTVHTVTGAPTAQVVGDLYLTKGRHELGVRARYIKGSPDDRANKTYEYWYVVRAPGEKPPEGPEELTKLFSTQRRNNVILFEFGDSGKIAYVSCRVANGKLKGEFGPIVSANSTLKHW